jgi:hypothetical protein
MNFKSKNWNLIKAQGLNVRVEYTDSDLHFRFSKKDFFEVPTTVVVIWNENCRYVGVAQCGPNDEFSKEKGREIASGRALKMLNEHIIEPDIKADHKLELDGQIVEVFGNIPQDVQDVISNSILFDGVAK